MNAAQNVEDVITCKKMTSHERNTSQHKECLYTIATVGTSQHKECLYTIATVGTSQHKECLYTIATVG